MGATLRATDDAHVKGGQNRDFWLGVNGCSGEFR